jgi:cysteine desulfurase
VGRIYLDHNATAPLAPGVAEAMLRAAVDLFANPSSVHLDGQLAKAALDEARGHVAALLGASPADVVFTGGGTEGDNLALRGALDAAMARGRRHLVVSTIEHEAVLNTAKALAARGGDVSWIPVDASGLVDPAALAPLLRADTALVSVMHANNEVGTVQPVRELADAAHAVGALLHTDAVQSAGKIPVDVGALGADLVSISGHKFGGPKGVGALWVRRGVKLTPIQTGGRQERSRRAGTENVPAVAGLGVAARLARERLALDGVRVAALRDRLERGVLDALADVWINGAAALRVPNTANIGFEGVEAEALLIALDLDGIAVSTGSACSSGTLEPSHVLRAMGLRGARAQNAIRFSLGSTTTDDEIDRVLTVLPGLVRRLRGVAARAPS